MVTPHTENLVKRYQVATESNLVVASYDTPVQAVKAVLDAPGAYKVYDTATL